MNNNKFYVGCFWNNGAENLSSETSYFVFEVAVSFYDTHVIEIVYKLTHSTLDELIPVMEMLIVRVTPEI